jgi:signal transduction histidine kinase
MKRRTLAGRMAVVQTAVTGLALIAVAGATAITVTVLLAKRTDDLLTDVAGRVSSVLERLPPETREPQWLAYEAEEQRLAGTRVEIRDPAGKLLTAIGENFDLPPDLVGCSDRGPVRACGVRSPNFAVVVAAPRAEDEAARRYLLLALAAITLFAVAAVAAASRAVARRGLRPLSDLAARVAGLRPGEGGRAGIRTEMEELAAFASRFDELLERFDEALARERRMAAQASHELRTPLTLARAEIEALARPGPDGGSIPRALEAVDRLAALVEALLWFAKAQTRLDDEAMEVVNVADVVRADVRRREAGTPLARLACDLPDEALVRGDERLLGRVIANLLDNALRYGHGAPVALRARRQNGTLELSIANAGTLTGEVRARLFEPFFRGNGAARDGDGFGLGLPFARAVARAHGGDLAAGDAGAERTTFVLTLPLIAWSDEALATSDA